MIIIITTNSIDLKQQINLKNTKKIKSIGELDLTIKIFKNTYHKK